MELIADIPGDFDEWINTTGYGDRRYLFYEYSRKKIKQGYCTICRSPVGVEKPRHHTYGVCPLCGGKVMFQVESRSKNLCDHKYIALFQNVPEGFVIRYFFVSRRFINLREPEFSVYETYREFNENGKWDIYAHDDQRSTVICESV